MEMETVDTCDECPAEAAVIKSEVARKLVCNISGAAAASGAVNVDHLHEGAVANVTSIFSGVATWDALLVKLDMINSAGVSLGLKGTIEKQSVVLGRNALWTRTARIKRLPRYICVQFMRFFVKEARVIEEVGYSLTCRKLETFLNKAICLLLKKGEGDPEDHQMQNHATCFLSGSARHLQLLQRPCQGDTQSESRPSRRRNSRRLEKGVSGCSRRPFK
jgi:hypothetical protein